MLTEIKNQVAEVLKYSQGLSEVKIDSLIDTWWEKKQKLFSILGNQLIKEVPEKISFELDDETKKSKYLHFCNNISEQSYRLESFLDNITYKEFYANSLAEDFPLPDGKKISAGTKVIKAFKYFIKQPNLLASLQDEASKLIQENKIEGTLCYSIHPLDYLSVSENTLNWRSCHALDGEWRAGNLSYMQDESTLVCYLRTDEKVKLPRFPSSIPWNNKKWRCLLFFNSNCSVVFAGRQYPFSAKSILDRARLELFNSFIWSPWYKDYISSFSRTNGDEVFLADSYLYLNHTIVAKNDIIKDAEGSRQFNDLLESSCYTEPYYMIKDCWMPNPPLTIGAKVTCIHCGQESVTSDDTMMCVDCECHYGTSDSEDYPTCDCCGERFYYPEGFAMGCGDYICPTCAEKETYICPSCGDREYISDRVYIPEKDEYYCKYCAKEIK